ncbi:MAG TPA: cytochrome P450 [Mesorhizobium sp.]|jgi:cytochrome P450|nr:cytochrome P450 [Mesorhizobium sp.]
MTLAGAEGHKGSSSGRSPRRPPGPKGVPLLGNLLPWHDPLVAFAEAARNYGDIVGLNFAGWPAVLVSDPEAIETILVRRHKDFVKNSFFWRHVTAIFGQGILTSEGELWQKQRRSAAPAFAGKQLLSYDAAMSEATGRMLNDWRDGQILDVHPELMGLTLRIAAKTLFDTEVEEEVAAIEEAVDVLVLEVASRFTRPIYIPDSIPLPRHIRYTRALRSIDRVVSRFISERRSAGTAGRQDFLSRLMAARDENGTPMSDKQLRDEAITLLLAGHETTALALSWTLYLLGRHKDTEARLAAEVRQALGDGPPTFEKLQTLKLLESVVLESMRLYPPAWIIGRESLAPFALGPYEFKKGTTVFISPWIIHRDPRRFAEPEAFHPERWMGGLADDLPRFAYLPFGGGPRICIGQRFAMLEAMLILAAIVRRFSVEWQGTRPPKPLPSITLRPQGGVRLKLRKRA